MNSIRVARKSRRIISKIIRRFSEKSELLAAESYEIFKKKVIIKPGENIHQIIGIIIIHQAVELALKAHCIYIERTIHKSGNYTISFEEALKRSGDVVIGNDREVLKILNNMRNNYQHSAIFDISSQLDPYDILLDSISIIVNILINSEYEPSELNIILKNEGYVEEVE